MLQPVIAHAQRYSFKYYGEDTGLPNLSIRAIAQDGSGFLWVGTESGLYRYDGKRFVAFPNADGSPFPVVEALGWVGGSLWEIGRAHV